MMRREYRKEFGSYYFYEDDRMRFMADEVAICFSLLDGNVVLHKHGIAADVNAWWTKNRQEYEPLFGDLHVVESDSWDPAELTECLERPWKIIELLQSVGQSLPSTHNGTADGDLEHEDQET